MQTLNNNIFPSRKQLIDSLIDAYCFSKFDVEAIRSDTNTDTVSNESNRDVYRKSVTEHVDEFRFKTLQCAFIDIASPPTRTIDETIQQYDENYSMPSDEMIKQFKAIVLEVKELQTFEDIYKVQVCCD